MVAGNADLNVVEPMPWSSGSVGRAGLAAILLRNGLTSVPDTTQRVRLSNAVTWLSPSALPL